MARINPTHWDLSKIGFTQVLIFVSSHEDMRADSLSLCRTCNCHSQKANVITSCPQPEHQSTPSTIQSGVFLGCIRRHFKDCIRQESPIWGHGGSSDSRNLGQGDFRKLGLPFFGGLYSKDFCILGSQRGPESGFSHEASVWREVF